MPDSAQSLKPFKAQYAFTLAATEIGDATRQQAEFLELARDMGFYPAEGSITALGEMNPMEVVPGSVLDQELCAVEGSVAA